MRTSFATGRSGKTATNFYVHSAQLLWVRYFFLVKVIHLSFLRKKEFSIGGGNLTNVNFANLGEQVKFVDVLKYYQQILVGIAETVAPEEKASIIKLFDKFLRTHDYFKSVWCWLYHSLRDKILELLASGKGLCLCILCFDLACNSPI